MVVEADAAQAAAPPVGRCCWHQLQHCIQAGVADGGGCDQHQAIAWLHQMTQLDEMSLCPAIQPMNAGQGAWIGAVGGHEQQIGAGCVLLHGDR